MRRARDFAELKDPITQHAKALVARLGQQPEERVIAKERAALEAASAC